jgi:hypothetical protein
VAVLCERVIAEITALPGVLLPGGTVTPLAGALIAAGRRRTRSCPRPVSGWWHAGDGKPAEIESYDVSGA